MATTQVPSNQISIDPGNGGSVATATDNTPPIVAVPTLVATKAASSTIVYPGETFSYTITLNNPSAVDSANPFTATDTLPSGITLATNAIISSTAGAVTNSGDNQNLNLSVAGVVPAGGTTTITIPVTVSNTATIGALPPNSATISPGNGASDVTATENTPPIVDVPELTVTKASSASVLDPATGSTDFVYTVVITNNGLTPTTNPFTMTDTLPTGITLNGAITSPNAAVTNSGDNQNLNLSIATAVAPGASVTLNIPVTVTSDAPSGPLGANSALINPGDGGPSVTGTDKSPPIIYYPQITGQKVASTTTVNPNGIFTYVLTLTNSGNAPTTNPFTFVENFPSGVTLAGTPTTNGALVSTTDNQTFSVNTTINPGQTITISIPVQLTGNAPLTQLAPNTVTVNPGGANGPTVITEITPPTVYAPTITATKKASSNILVPGDTFNYTITVTNTGTVTTSNPFTLTDALPNNVTLGGTPTATAGHVVNNGDTQNLNLSIQGAIPPGGSVDIVIPVTLNPNAPVGPLPSNSATLSPGNGGSTITTTETSPPIVDIPVPLVTKTPSVTTIAQNDTFDYVVLINNNGNVDMSNPFTVTDVLPPDLTLSGPITSSVGPVTNLGVGNTLNLSVAGDVSAGATATITIPVTVNPNAPIGTLGQNAAVVDPGSGGHPSTGTDKNPPIIYAPVLAVTKTADTSTISPDGYFNYVVTVTNNGNYPTTNPFTVTDVLPTSVTLANDPVIDTGTVVNTGSNTNLNLVVRPGLAVGGEVTITIPVKLDPHAPAGTLGNNSLTASGGNGSSDVTMTDSNPPVISTPVVSGTKVATSDTLYPGDTFAYTVTLTNTGTVETSNPFTLSENFPTGVTYLGPITSSNGSLISSTGSASSPIFSIFESIPPGGSVTLNIPVVLNKNTPTGVLGANNAVISGGNGSSDVTISENTPPTVDTSVPIVTKSSSITQAIPGESFSYTLTIYNNGDLATSNPFTVTDDLPTGISLNGPIVSTAGPVTVSGSGASLSLSIAGSIPPGGTATITIPVVIADDIAAGSIGANTAIVDPGVGGESTTATDKNPPNVAFPVLAVTKAADTTVVHPCGTFNYVITVTNTGNLPTSSPLTVTDTLPVNLTLNGPVTADTGVVTNTGSGTQLNLSLSASLAPGATMHFTIPVRVDCNAPASQLPSNFIQVIGGGTLNPTTTTDEQPPTVVTEPRFDDGQKIACPRRARPCDVVTYTLTATNTGSAVASSFVVTDKLPLVALTGGGEVPVELLVCSVAGTLDGAQMDVGISGSEYAPIFSLTDCATGQPASIPVGEVVSISFKVRIPYDAVCPQTILNSAIIAGGGNVSDGGVYVYCHC